MSEEKVNPKEEQQKYLAEMEWPPVLELEGQRVQLDEMDVDWTFCTVLNMRWKDTKLLKDVDERKFLWNKAQMMALALEQQASRDSEQKETARAKYR